MPGEPTSRGGIHAAVANLSAVPSGTLAVERAHVPAARGDR